MWSEFRRDSGPQLGALKLGNTARYNEHTTLHTTPQISCVAMCCSYSGAEQEGEWRREREREKKKRPNSGATVVKSAL